MPEPIVPSQKASTSDSGMPADVSASDEESMSRSSVLRSQCSPNVVHPIPTIATWSLMPFDAITDPFVSIRPGSRDHNAVGWELPILRRGPARAQRIGRAFQK